MSAQSVKLAWDHNREKQPADTLVFLLHGMDCNATTVAPLANTIQQAIPSASLYIPTLPLHWHQCVSLKEVGAAIVGKLREAMSAQTFGSLLLIGHSAGGVLIQAVYLMAQEDPAIRAMMSPLKVRLFLIAPMSRGWTVSHHLPLPQKIAWTVGLWLLPLLRLKAWLAHLFRGTARHDPWIVQVQKGAPFLVWLRLAWLKFNNESKDVKPKPALGTAAKPEIYVILGSVDEIISWRDMVDAVTGDDNVGHFQIPFSDHAHVIDFEDAQHGKTRARIFTELLKSDLATACTLREYVVPWDDSPIEPDYAVERMVFVIHGIRDEGHWTQKIAALAIAKHKDAGLRRNQIKIETSSYGYFSMLEFLNPQARYAKMHWLMDEYVEAKRRYPNARFSFIGHSNGTYLLAQSLRNYPEVTFDRVAFAGSVVSRNFNWGSLIDGQVGHVLNFTASNDWVVSLFPRIADIFPALEWVLGPNLGGAGVTSFRDAPCLSSNNYVRGAHGAAIQEENWEALALFAVAAPGADNKPPIPRRDTSLYVNDQWRAFRRDSIGSLTTCVALVLLIGILAYLGWLAWTNPRWFWGFPVASMVVLFAIVSLIVQATEGAAFSRRKLLKKWSGIAAAGGIALVLSIVAFGPLFQWWRDTASCPEWIRTLSLAAYILGLHRALTRM